MKKPFSPVKRQAELRIPTRPRASSCASRHSVIFPTFQFHSVTVRSASQLRQAEAPGDAGVERLGGSFPGQGVSPPFSNRGCGHAVFFGQVRCSLTPPQSPRSICTHCCSAPENGRVAMITDGPRAEHANTRIPSKNVVSNWLCETHHANWPYRVTPVHITTLSETRHERSDGEHTNRSIHNDYSNTGNLHSCSLLRVLTYVYRRRRLPVNGELHLTPRLPFPYCPLLSTMPAMLPPSLFLKPPLFVGVGREESSASAVRW